MNSASMERWSPEQLAELNKILELKFLGNRLVSFSQPEQEIITLAKHGFYQSSDYYECFSCGFRITNDIISNEDQRTLEEFHRDAGLECSYRIGLEPSLQLSLRTQAKDQYVIYNSSALHNEIKMREELQRLRNIPNRIPLYIPTSTLIRVGGEEGEYVLKSEFNRLVMNPEKIYKLYQLRMNREYSFRSTDLPIHVKNGYIDAGFFYTGFRMVVQCAFCCIAYTTHLARHPMMMHGLFNPNCPFLVNDSFEIDRNLCHICFDVSQEVLYLPCRHLIACNDCDVKRYLEIKKLKNVLIVDNKLIIKSE